MEDPDEMTTMGGLHAGRLGALSDPGRRRKNNQDAILTLELTGGRLLIAVADGVGGERGGDVASALAVEAVRKRFQSAATDRHDADLRAAAADANRAVWLRSRDDARLRGMATTLVAALIAGDKAWLANVGDSRAYLIDRDSITQITDDHSLVAERMREGGITAEEAQRSRARHVITRSIGSEEWVEADSFGPIPTLAGSRLLLCSDGLTDVVDDDEILSVASAGTPEAATAALVDAANRRGGPDNISVILWAAPS